MYLRILGSAAGGGFPQWNCNCPNCQAARTGSRPTSPRTQASLAVSADGERWLLVNASPDIRTQIDTFPSLHPSGPNPRTTPIGAVMLTNADVDHVCGLLSLREFQPLVIYSTPQVRTWITEGNVIFNVLKSIPGQSDWQPVALGLQQTLLYQNRTDSGLIYEALAVPCKVPGYLGKGVQGVAETIALKVIDWEGNSLVYVPGIKQIDDTLLKFIADTQVIFFDGTFWDDEELVRLGLAEKSALSLGHIPMSGPKGSIASLQNLQGPRKIFTHINNTNPVLLEDSNEHRIMKTAGWELAFDGLEIRL